MLIRHIQPTCIFLFFLFYLYLFFLPYILILISVFRLFAEYFKCVFLHVCSQLTPTYIPMYVSGSSAQNLNSPILSLFIYTPTMDDISIAVGYRPSSFYIYIPPSALPFFPPQHTMNKANNVRLPSIKEVCISSHNHRCQSYCY